MYIIIYQVNIKHEMTKWKSKRETRKKNIYDIEIKLGTIGNHVIAYNVNSKFTAPAAQINI